MYYCVICNTTTKTKPCEHCGNYYCADMAPCTAIVPCDTCANGCQDCNTYPRNYCPNYEPAAGYEYMYGYDWNVPYFEQQKARQIRYAKEDGVL